MSISENGILELAGIKNEASPVAAIVLERYRKAVQMLKDKYGIEPLEIKAIRKTGPLQRFDAYIMDTVFGEAEIRVLSDGSVLENVFCLKNKEPLEKMLKEHFPVSWQDGLVIGRIDGFADQALDKDSPFLEADQLTPTACILIPQNEAMNDSFPADTEVFFQALRRAGIRGVYSVYLLSRDVSVYFVEPEELLDEVLGNGETVKYDQHFSVVLQ